MEEYQEALKEYFKLKAKYDKQLNTKKHAVLVDDDLSIKEKRSQIQKIKKRMKCIGCGRNVGTIFEDKNRTYSAVCGNRESPCNLHISIKKGEIINLKNVYNDEVDYRNKIRNEIITTKLDVLFGLIDYATMEEKFEELKTKNADSSNYISMIERLIHYEDERIELNIKEGTNELYSLLSEQKELLEEYMVDTSPAKMRDLIELYVESIIPTLEAISLNKYEYREVEKCDINIDSTDNKKCLHTKKNIIEKFESIYTDPEVVEFRLK